MGKYLVDISELPQEEQDALVEKIEKKEKLKKDALDKEQKVLYVELIKLRDKFDKEIETAKTNGKIPARASLRKICDLPGRDASGKQKGPTALDKIANWMRRNYGNKKKTPAIKIPPTKKPAKKK